MSRTNFIASKIAGYISCLVIALCMCVHASAQQYPMLHFTTDDGLPSNTVYQVYRDSKGFLWIATDQGIARYNGAQFEKFSTYDGMPDNEIFFFTEDLENRIWMGAYNGEICYFKDNVFHTARNTPWLQKVPANPYINTIDILKDSSIVLNFSNRSYIVTIKHEQTICDSMPFGSRSINIEKMQDGNFRFWKLKDTISVADSHGKIIRQTIGNYGPVRLIPDYEQRYFVNTNTAFDKEMQPIAQLAPLHTSGYEINSVRNIGGSLFIGTKSGLFVGDSLKVLDGQNVTNVDTDKFGNFWISTIGNGIYELKKNFADAPKVTLPSGIHIRYASSEHGYTYCAGEDNTLLRLNRHSAQQVLDFGKYGQDSVKKSACLVTDSFYYVATVKYLYKIRYYGGPPVCQKYFTGISDEFIKHIYIREGQLFQLGSRIIFRNAVSEFSGSTLPRHEIFIGSYANKVFGVATRADGKVWYSTGSEIGELGNGGIVEKPKYSGLHLKKFEFVGDYIAGYSPANKLMVCREKNGKLFVDSTIGEGENCIWNNVCKLDEAHLLLATNNYYRILTALASDSMPRIDLNTIEDPFVPKQCDHIFSDGEQAIFFKNAEATCFRLSDLYSTVAPPTLFMQKTRARNGSIDANSVVSLPYSESRNVSFSFLPVTNGCKQIEYAYSVSDNKDENWKYTTQNEVDLVNPDYGTYTVTIKAKTPGSKFSTPILFTLIIERPWWATWWFRSSIAAIIIGIVVLITRYRINANNRKNELLHVQEVRFLKSEYKALNALMNPHFIFNTLNNMQSLVNKDEKRAANEYLRIFANLIRQNMHNISLDMISLQDEMDLVANYLKLEKLRFKEFLNYEINVDEQVDLTDVMVPPLLIQPLVENSIKHGLFPRKSTDNYLIINIRETNEVLFIEVKDNGLGFSASRQRVDPQHKSFGMENLRKRIEQASIIQGRKMTLDISDKADEHGNHNWTVVTITIVLADGKKD